MERRTQGRRMTNFEKIKNSVSSMSIEEMAREIFDKVEEGCRYCSQKKCSPITVKRDCIGSIIDWLQREVEE